MFVEALNGTIVLPSAARTTDQTVNIDIAKHLKYSGLIVVVDLTAFVTAASLTVTIRGRDIASNKVYTLLASAAITAVSTVVLRVGQGLPATANISANDVVPPSLQIFADLGNANSHTYSVGLQLAS